jgi:hypothetical protein
MTKVFLSLILLTQVCYGQNFISVDDAFLPQSGNGISIVDFNNDNFKDVLICGNNTNGVRVCNSYLNNGDFDFELIEGNSISGVVGDCDFADVDNDGDQDLFVIGQNNLFVRIAELYLNDGNGIFY